MANKTIAQITDPATLKTFMLAGNAILTAVSDRTGIRFTFKIQISKDGRVHYVSVLTGQDYSFLGVLFANGTYQHSIKSPIGIDALSNRAFRWTWGHVNTGKMPKDVTVYHAGSCGRCGRCLTVPESIAMGIGPDCAEIMGLTVAPIVATVQIKRGRKIAIQPLTKGLDHMGCYQSAA